MVWLDKTIKNNRDAIRFPINVLFTESPFQLTLNLNDIPESLQTISQQKKPGKSRFYVRVIYFLL